MNEREGGGEVEMRAQVETDASMKHVASLFCC